MNRSDEIWIRLMETGKLFGCHQMADRSFFIKGYQFPVCARCTGVLLGQTVALVQILLGRRLSRKLTITAIMIMGVDWGLQYLQLLPSTNMRRLVTGAFCGIGLTFEYFYALRLLVRIISKGYRVK